MKKRCDQNQCDRPSSLMRLPRSGQRVSVALLAAALLFAIPVAMAQSGTRSPPAGATPNALPGGGGGDAPTPKTYFEQGILVRSGETIEALGPNLMGDSINEYSGGLEFTQTEVSLPGNNALPVAVGRHLVSGSPQTFGDGHFGNWELEIPRLHSVTTQAQPNWYGGNNASNYNRCSQFSAPPMTTISTSQGPASYTSNSFWDGYHLYVPGAGDQTLLSRGNDNLTYPSDGTASTYPVVTKNHWQLSCLPNLDNGPGEGFLARSPDGTSYRFDHIASRAWPQVKVSYFLNNWPGTAYIQRAQIWLLPTLVTDRFGNWVRYTYGGGGDASRVASIASSDGRSISFGYSGNRIQSATDGTRTWSYGYSTAGGLQTVTQPDLSTWTFALDQLKVDASPYSAGDPMCDNDADWSGKPPTSGTITHPSGAVGTFVLNLTTHGRSGVPGTACNPLNKVGSYFAAWSLTSKTLSGPGMQAMTWNYAYSAAWGSFAPCNGCANTKAVTITDPLSNVTVNTYGTQYGLNEGLLLRSVEGVAGGSSLRSTSYAYNPSNAGPYPSKAGSTLVSADSMSGIHTPQKKRVITQQGVDFTSEVTSFDTYARATGLTRSSTLGYSRTEATGYSDNKTLWVMGQVETHTIAGVEAARTTFALSTALPTQSKKFGKLSASYTFNGDGTLAILTDGLGHATAFGNYKRGLPQRIIYADNTAIDGVVNDIGLLTSVTNEARTTWAYGYDAMGRLASKTPPGGDPVAYNATTLSFVKVPVAELGLQPNHWRQTITTGTAVTINYFDARWRKRLTITSDTANPGGTQRMQRFDYDPYNRTTFAAYPARSIGTITSATPGAATAYDALGRPTQTIADSEIGALTTTTEYLSGFQTRVINPRNYAATTAFQVFDEPSEAAIVSIAAPAGLSVAITRDVFGKPSAISRSGSYGGTAVSATRSYVYDLNQLLCKTIEPEIGATLQSLDAANNVSWRAIGLSLPSTTSCDTTSAPSAKKIAYTYDARNRLTGTGFGDGSPAIGRSYTPDGLPATVLSNGSTWTYSYNNRRLLKQESLAYGSTFNIGWGYDANGHTSQLTYPDGAVVSYTPNALGEATQVSGFAGGVTYHPNGAVAGYTLSNGIVHSLSQNTRGLPLQNRDAGVMQDQYAFDANANVNSITDQQEGVSTRLMGYDGLDRLIVANAGNVWGAAQYNYDPLDNLRVSVVGARSSNHNYDASNRLSTINTNGVYTGYVYDTQGNITGRGAQGFFFDQGNRMTLASNVANYAYDGLGRRVASYANTGLNKTQVYGQAGQLLYESRQQAMSSWQTRYVYLGGKLIAEVDTSAGTSYVHTDALGSPVARTNSAGALLSRTRYEAYGKTAAGTNPIGIGFTGHVNDADTGLVYMQQRYYDPVAGRFLSVDPVTTDADTGYAFNRYEYANSNPYRYTDPDGRQSRIQGISGDWITIYQASGSGSSSSSSSTPSRSTTVAASAALGGSAGAVVAAGCAAGTAGVCGLGAPAIVGAGIAGGALLGNAAANLFDWIGSTLSSIGASGGNTNPYTGPVSEPVVVVDNKGNAIPVDKGQQVKGAPNGDYQQVLGADGRPTGDRLDRGGHKGQKDPAAQQPHGHRPGVTAPDGNPHLPIN